VGSQREYSGGEGPLARATDIKLGGKVPAGEAVRNEECTTGDGIRGGGDEAFPARDELGAWLGFWFGLSNGQAKWCRRSLEGVLVSEKSSARLYGAYN
jgi:hypothetical protein